MAGIIGFGVAAELAVKDLAEMAAVAKLRDALEDGVRAIAQDAMVFSSTVPRLPNTSSFAVSRTKAETLVIGLDLAGIAVSAGSACSSGKVEASHVLAAMGVEPELVQGAIRVSLGVGSENTDIQSFLSAFSDLIKRLKRNTKAAA